MSESITTEEIQALRALCEKATPGPWSTEIDDPCSPWYVLSDDGDLTATALMYSDAAFIAASRAAVPRLLDEIEHERQTVDNLRDNICVMTVESLDDKDEFKRLKALARELADAYREGCKCTDSLRDRCIVTCCIIKRPDVAELREESDEVKP